MVLGPAPRSVKPELPEVDSASKPIEGILAGFERVASQHLLGCCRRAAVIPKNCSIVAHGPEKQALPQFCATGGASSRRVDASAFLARYDALDAALVARGFPATSPWWRKQIERFVRSGRRRWVIRAGRRAGKSSTLCRLAVAWALWGTWQVPPGDTAVIPFVSVDRSEAAARLKTIAEFSGPWASTPSLGATSSSCPIAG